MDALFYIDSHKALFPQSLLQSIQSNRFGSVINADHQPSVFLDKEEEKEFDLHSLEMDPINPQSFLIETQPPLFNICVYLIQCYLTEFDYHSYFMDPIVKSDWFNKQKQLVCICIMLASVQAIQSLFPFGDILIIFWNYEHLLSSQLLSIVICVESQQQKCHHI